MLSREVILNKIKTLVDLILFIDIPKSLRFKLFFLKMKYKNFVVMPMSS
jgi:hypothetical protein